MAFIPVPGVIRVFWEHEFLGNPGKGWVQYFQTGSGVVNGARLDELGELLVDWWDVNAQPLMTDGVALQRIRLRNMEVAEGSIRDFVTGLPLTGTRVGNTMPANVAYCIKLSSGLAGRSKRGRMYWFAMAEDDVADNFVTVSYSAAVVAAVDALSSLLVGTIDNYALSVVSFFFEGQPRTEGVPQTILSGVAVDRRVDTQRRRLG